VSFWTSARVAEALGVPAPHQATYTAVATDTRTLPASALFVALTGDRFDGHKFLGDAKARGAQAAVVKTGTAPVPGLAFYAVPDTLIALGNLARFYRRALNLDGPVVAVTGTNGKTSTKQMLAAVLSRRYRVHATVGNLNNLVGVPLTLLGAPADSQTIVVEAGANQPGEIPRLKEIIEPDVAVITNVGPGHLEGFGSLDGVLREKLALVDGVGLTVVGMEPPDLGAKARERSGGRTITAGLEAGAQVHPDAATVAPDGRATIRWRGQSVTLPLPGRHLAANAMLALAVATESDVTPAAAMAALADITVPEGRSQVVSLNGLTVLNDCYNANPTSLAAALDTLDAMRAGRRAVVVVGTMLELGKESAAWHRRMADAIVARDPGLIAAVGAFADAFAPHRDRLGAKLLTAKDAEALGPKLKQLVRRGDVVLLKASRGVELERVLAHLS
jgi:UDP-N-acetylmuramoyl-tripeptide--D-alanyl-D-alanine ligase